MGFYNVAKGDAPYLTELAREYTLNDNYHQAAMGGTYANHMMIGYAGELYYADQNGDPATPNHVLVPGSNPPVFVDEVENPNPAPGTNNWYANDGYGGGSYTNCSDPTQPGVAPIVSLPECASRAGAVRAERLLPAQQLCTRLHRQRRHRPDQQRAVHAAAGDQAEAHRR